MVEVDHAELFFDQRDGRQEQLPLQSARVELGGGLVGGCDHRHAFVDQHGQDTAEQGRIGDVVDEEFVKAQHLGALGLRPGEPRGRVTPRVALFPAGMDIRVQLAHELVEVAALRLLRPQCLVEQVHGRGFAAPDRAEEVKTAGEGCFPGQRLVLCTPAIAAATTPEQGGEPAEQAATPHRLLRRLGGRALPPCPRRCVPAPLLDRRRQRKLAVQVFERFDGTTLRDLWPEFTGRKRAFVGVKRGLGLGRHRPFVSPKRRRGKAGPPPQRSAVGHAAANPETQPGFGQFPPTG